MITAEQLRERLDYNPSTGVFSWVKVRKNPNVGPGSVAGSVGAGGYICIKFNGRTYKAHRLAFLYITGEWPSDEIDHINGNPADNSFSNLREVTPSQNCGNKRRYKNNSTGLPGVTFSSNRNRWRAAIKQNHKPYHLGYHATIFEAACARKSAENRLDFHPNHGR